MAHSSSQFEKTTLDFLLLRCAALLSRVQRRLDLTSVHSCLLSQVLETFLDADFKAEVVSAAPFPAVLFPPGPLPWIYIRVQHGMLRAASCGCLWILIKRDVSSQTLYDLETV